MKIKFNSDDNLPLKQELEMQITNVVNYLPNTDLSENSRSI